MKRNRISDFESDVYPLLVDMRVLFIMNGVTYGASGRPNVSGGDIILIEIAKRWLQKGVEIHFLTSSAGKELCERLGLKATYHVSSGSHSPSIWNYLFLALKTLIAEPKPLTKASFDLVYSSCEHLYDVLPAFKMKKKNVKWVAMVHFVPPSPWVRMKAGMFNAFFYYLNHMLGASILRNNADLVLAVSQRTALDYIFRLKFDKDKMVTIPGGVDYRLIRSIAESTPKKKYDAVFMKRLQPMKGIFDVIEVWRRVVASCPKAKLLIVGDGPTDVVTRMRHMIAKFGLAENIEIKGPVYDIKEKISLLASSKLFLLPSYEENWAVVIGEALTTGLPVVAYDLPEIKQIWAEHVLWVPKGDTKSFAEEVVKLLSDEKYYQMYVGKGIDFMKKFDWEHIAERVLELCTKLIGFK